MRIIEFSDTFYPVMDGVGNVVYQYAMNLGQKGHECYVVAPQTDTGYRGNWPFELVDYTGIRMPMMKSYKVGMPSLDAHCQKRLNMLSADIVHVHSPFTAGQAGLTWAQKHGVPVIGTFHSKYYDDFLQVTGQKLLAEVGVKFVVDFYEKCNEVWAVSHSSAETLHSYGYKGEIRVMGNGTDLHTIRPEAVATVSERFGLNGDPLLLFVGQMNWKKNIRCVLTAAAELKQPFQLVLAGQGPHEKEIVKLAEELALGQRFRYIGHQTDREVLDALYARADLFVFPSIYDNAPLVVREAAAMGTPAVVVRDSSAAECVTDGENGLLCADDPADLARVIDKALSDRPGLRTMGENARKTIPVPWSDLVDSVLECYQELIDRYSSKEK